jgi:hypothetical protein
MSIIRTKSPHRFTIVSNELLAEKNPLSWEATGLLIYLLSKPDNWNVSIAALTNIGKCGKNKIESILKELKQLGYIVGKRHCTGKYNYYVYDTPQSPEFTPKPENQVMAKKPKPENPVQAFPEQDNRVLINTEVLLTNTEKTTTTSTPIQNAAPLVGLTPRQNETVSEQLAQLTPEQQAIAVQSFNVTVSSGKVTSTPMALISGLIKKGLRNELEPIKSTQTAQATQTPADKTKARLEVIKCYVAIKKADCLKQFEKSRAVFINGVGTVYPEDLKLAGLFD